MLVTRIIRVIYMKRIAKAVLSLIGMCVAGNANAAIVINEAMPSNLSTYMDMSTYEYTPWIEVFNSGETAVNLKGYTLRYTTHEDGLVKEATIAFDCSIEGGAYKLLFMDKADQKNHVGFKLDADGGDLVLLDAAGKTISSLNIPDICAYVSYGVGESANGYMVPTPGKANSTAFASANLAEFQKTAQCAVPVFSKKAGAYHDIDTLKTTITCATTGAKIYYTTDGSIPTKEKGILYEGEIKMTKPSVIRARAYASDMVYSPIVTASYIFNSKNHKWCSSLNKLPIVSIVTAKENLDDPTIGIATKGSNGIDGDCGTTRANYNQDWKRPMNFEYIVDGQAVINQEVEAKVMGGCSRSHETKSFSLSTSKKCGSGMNKMKYPFFKSKPSIKKFKSLHLRNGGNDFDGLRFRDGFMQSIIHGENIDYQAYQPVGYFLNGHYEGLMLLNEHTNEDYLYSNYDLDDEEIDLIKITKEINVSNGTIDAYDKLIEEAQSGQNTPGYYEKMSKLMDMDEYMTYMAFEQYLVNTDWPGNNNKLWRHNKGGRFRWILYDTDFGFGLFEGWGPNYTSYTTNMIQFCAGEGSCVNWANGSNHAPYTFSKDSEWKTILFKNLMKNEEFRSRFLTKNLMLLEKTFKPERVIAILDSIAKDAYPEYCAMSANEHWQPKESYEGNDEYNGMKEFANKRPAYVYQHLANFYGGNEVNLTITSNVSGARFNINGNYCNKSKYEGKYISNNRLNVSPIAPDGYKFKNWKLSAAESSTLLSSASEWLYSYTAEGQADGWQAADFAATGWKKGSGRFGYGGPSKYNVTLDFGKDKDNKPITAYFRTTVNVEEIGNFEKITAKLTYDDGYVIYVNGTEVARGNMPKEEAITSETLAVEYANDDEATVDIATKYFKNGENTIAVEIHQNSATSSDLTFEMSLKGIGKATGTTSTKMDFSTTVTDNFSMEAVFVEDTEPAGIFINEVCTSNKGESSNDATDEFGKYGDWIEIYNAGSQDVNIAGWYISDNSEKLNKYQIPYSQLEATNIPAKGHIVIWCDNDVYNGPLHASFKLSETSANTITLSKDKGGVVTKVNSIELPANIGTNNSYGRVADGSEELQQFYMCSWKTANKARTTMGTTNGLICDTNDLKKSDNDDAKVRIYPNPVENELNIVSDEAIAKVRIYDNIGRTIATEEGKGVKKKSINTSHLIKGIYTINIETTDNNVRVKFIKK